MEEEEGGGDDGDGDGQEHVDVDLEAGRQAVVDQGSITWRRSSINVV